jgi:hypothetical protein
MSVNHDVMKSQSRLSTDVLKQKWLVTAMDIRV